MSYKSKHTGAQVDEAVSKVLNGEVGGGADWNAKAGEPGYIENRTHSCDIIGGKTLKDISAASYLYDDSNLKSHETEYIAQTELTYMKLVYEQNLEIHIEHLYIGPKLIKCNQGERIYYNSDAIYQFDYSYDEDTDNEIYTSTIWVNVDYQMDNMEDDELLEYAKGTAKESILVYDMYLSVTNGKYFKKKTLEDIYLPDTVIKTTPQTLSDTDKNQALTNLGIDPVVWKYMCNPCIIKDGEKVPEELIGDWDEDEGDRYHIKYPYLNMYLFKYDNTIFRPCHINDIGLGFDDIYAYNSDIEDIRTLWGGVRIDEDKKWFFE